MSADLTIQLGAASPQTSRCASVTHTGNRPLNEDAWGQWENDRWLCLAVADGAGGHGAGEVASALAVKNLLALFSANPNLDEKYLKNLVYQVNRVLLKAQTDCLRQQNMRTTLAALFVDRHQHCAAWLHVGDTRIYRCRQGVLFSRTRDHSMLQWLKDNKTQRETLQNENNTLRNELYTALGEPSELLTVTVHTPPVRIQSGDQFLLCSDGLWECFSDDEIAFQARERNTHPDGFLAMLQGLTMVRMAGSADNMTGLAVFFD